MKTNETESNLKEQEHVTYVCPTCNGDGFEKVDDESLKQMYLEYYNEDDIKLIMIKKRVMGKDGYILEKYFHHIHDLRFYGAKVLGEENGTKIIEEQENYDLYYITEIDKTHAEWNEVLEHQISMDLIKTKTL